jgi:hypothetical protein
MERLLEYRELVQRTTDPHIKEVRTHARACLVCVWCGCVCVQVNVGMAILELSCLCPPDGDPALGPTKF